MSTVFKMGPGHHGPPVAAVLVRLGLLLVPTLLLLGVALRHPGTNDTVPWAAAGFQGLICVLTIIACRSWRQPVGPTLIPLYLVAFAWMWCNGGANDFYTLMTKATLLVVPLVAFAYHLLHDSGAPTMRRARLLANRLAHRKEWPAELAQCRTLPEVKALRAALSLDATPALALLQHARPEVRVAALAALEFRKDWRPGQAKMVLQTAQRAEQPAIRAAAVWALANVEERMLAEAVAQFLCDPSLDVRRATTEALLWDSERRWPWIRFNIRRSLADPLYADDGPLVHEGQLLTAEAVKDLTGWCAEKGLLPVRSAMTLTHHYSRAMTERPDQRLVQTLRQQLVDPQTPAVLRLELGRLLQKHQELDLPHLEQMLMASNPAPLRLIAVETLLADHPEHPVANAALSTLRDLARLPNREISLASADVIQRRLGVDLGMAMGQPPPPIHSRQAADLTRRVMAWANQYALPEGVEDSKPLESGIRKRGA